MTDNEDRMLSLLALVECSCHLRDAADHVVGATDSPADLGYVYCRGKEAGHYGNAVLDLIDEVGRPTFEYAMRGSEDMTLEERLRFWRIAAR